MVPCSRLGTCGDLTLLSLIPRRSTILAETALEILPRWEDALAGIEEYSHLFVIVWLDRARRARKPRRHVPEGARGCQRWDCLLLVPRAGRIRSVSAHHDCSAAQVVPSGSAASTPGSGTPILDIKGYAPRDDLRQDATVPNWLETLWSAHDAELKATTASSAITRQHRQLEPANRSGLAMASIATIFPCRIVKSRTIISDHVAQPPRRRRRSPAPAALPARDHASPTATASAPRTSCGPATRTATASERKTTSGSRTASKP